MYNGLDPNKQILSKNILAAIATGFICDTITNPLWVVRTRIQSQYLHQDPVIKYKGIYNGLNRIYHEVFFSIFLLKLSIGGS